MPLDATAYYEAMSPTLLAQQPVEPRDSDVAPGKNWAELFVHFEQRYASMRTWRFSWWSYWASLAEFILPKRYHWLIVPNTFDRGLPINNAIVDSTATLAMRTCAAGMWSGLTSPSRPWFKLGIGLPGIELDADGRAWLEDSEERLYYVLSQSNFYAIMAQAFQDVATFGTAPVIIYEDAETLIRCYLPCAGEYYLAVGSRLTVDTLYREFNLTVLGIVEMFGIENCPEVIRGMWRIGGASLDREYVVCQAIEPNYAIKSRSGNGEIRVVPGSFTYREVYWLKGVKTNAELSRRGFREKPFFVARWSVVSNDPYGRSPGMDCLGDTKQLQQETRRKGEFIEKLVRPPMGANLDMKNEPSSIQPGMITYTSTDGQKKGFWPLFEVQPAALAPMIQDIQEVQKRIERAFFVDVFMAITRMEGVQPRNELELTKRDLERLQELGPFVKLWEDECAEPALTRVMTIMQRNRLLKPMPDSLQGVPLKFTFMSMMKIAQAAAQNTTIASTVQQGILFAQGAQQSGAPDPLDNLDLDQSLRTMADNANFPVKLVRSEQQVAEMRQQRSQAQQMQGVAAIAPAAVDAAKTLSDTSMAPGSALSAIMGR